MVEVFCFSEFEVNEAFQGSGSQAIKRYLTLFTCFKTLHTTQEVFQYTDRIHDAPWQADTLLSLSPQYVLVGNNHEQAIQDTKQPQGELNDRSRPFVL